MASEVILQSLRNVRRRVRFLTLALGSSVVGVAAILLLVLASLIDFLFNLAAPARIALIVAALAALLSLLVRFVLRPLLNAPALTDVAARLEAVFPQFDDRLRSALDFVGGKVPGSATMQKRVVEETEKLVVATDLRSAVQASPAIGWASALALGAIALAALAILIGPGYRDSAIARLFNPFANHPWPKSVLIAMDGQVPARVAAGDHLDLRMHLARGERASLRAIVRYQYDDGPVQQELMTRNPDGSYAAQIDAHVDEPRTTGSIHAWISAGDDQVVLPTVTVVPRLMIQSVQALVAPPPYVSDRTASSFDLAGGPLTAVAGSDISLRVAFSKPLARDPSAVTLVASDDGADQSGAGIVAKNAAPAVRWELESDKLAVGHLVAGKSFRFRIRGTDVDGLPSDAVEEYELAVRPDQPPTIQIDEPRRNEERTPTARLTLAATAEDDLGIKWVKLIVDRVSQRDISAAAEPAPRPGHWELPLVRHGAAIPTTQPGQLSFAVIDSSPLHRRYHLDYAWELSQLPGADLRPGDVLEYRLAAQDEFLANGKERDPALSGALRITIISQDELSALVNTELSAIAGKILEIKQAQGRTRQDTAALASDTHAKPALDAADRVAGQRLTGEQSSEASGAKELAARAADVRQVLEDNRSPDKDLKELAGEASDILTRVAEGPMNQAAGAIAQATSDQSPLSKNAARREQALTAATDQQQAAEDAMSQLLSRMNDVSSLQQAVDRLAAILSAQHDLTQQTADLGRNNVGKTPNQMSPQDQKKLADTAAAQAKLADRTAAAIDQMTKAAAQLAATDADAANAMQHSAETGQNQQVASNQAAAASAAQQNQQAQAQQNQQAAEIGLDSMISELREAQRHKLEELSRKLADMQEQVAILLRRQAGHNLDNLIGQGTTKLAAAGATVTDLAQLAERQPPATQPTAPAPLMAQGALPPPRQADAQALTERNTRDLSKVAQALPNGAEPSARLLRAASRMERAVVPLRDLHLNDAYDPPQVEALAALQAAKSIIDQQKRNVDQQILNSQKDTLRQKYVKIRGDQQRIATDVPRIDQSRAPDGSLGRVQQVRLAQLPAEQQALTERVKEIEPDLAGLDSIVYTWANRDLARQMGSAEQQLARQQTDLLSQHTQNAILAALDDIIASLKVQPLVSPFAQDNNGGGGQSSGAPPLPTEAELRMLKALQLTLNRNTVDANAIPNQANQNAELLDLGTRQSDLRTLLDKLLEKASRGSAKLGPEPPNKDLLPEELAANDSDDRELDSQLLTGKPGAEPADQQVNRVGDRMSRSRQRLALNHDGGQVTQLVQQKIVSDLDDLIQQARQREAQTRNSPHSSPQQQAQPADAQASAQNQGKPQPAAPRNPGATPAANSRHDGPPGQDAQLSADIKQSLAEWGQVTPRLRQALVDGSGESVVEPYRKMIEDYYKSLATKSSGANGAGDSNNH
jgi:hypothetical protein